MLAGVKPRQRASPHPQPTAPEGHLRRSADSNVTSPESQMPRDLCHTEDLQWDLLAALCPLTQLGGTIQRLPQGARHSEPCRGWGSWAVQMTDPPNTCFHPTAIHQTSQRWSPSRPHRTNCYNTPNLRRLIAFFFSQTLTKYIS